MSRRLGSTPGAHRGLAGPQGARRAHRGHCPRTAATTARSRISGDLVHDAVLEVRDPRRLDCAELLELQIRSYSVEEARASAQEDRRDVQLQLVDQTGRQVLVDDVGAAADEDVLLAGGLPRLLQGRLDSIGDKGEGRVREDQRLALVVRENEDRLAEGRVLTPPAPPWIVAPCAAGGRTELAPPHDLGADIRILLGDHGTADVLLAALHADALAPRLQPGHPVVKPFAALTERVLLALVRAGNVAVQRSRDVHSYLAHVAMDRSQAGNSSVEAVDLLAIVRPRMYAKPICVWPHRSASHPRP